MAVVRFYMVICVSQPAWIVVVAVLPPEYGLWIISSIHATRWKDCGFWLVTVAVKCYIGNHITACFDHPVPLGSI